MLDAADMIPATASTESSICARSHRLSARVNAAPPPPPITKAAHGHTESAPAQMDTWRTNRVSNEEVIGFQIDNMSE